MELNEWITLADALVRNLGTYNSIAPNAVIALAAIRRRVQKAMQTHGSNSSNPSDGVYLSSIPLPLDASLKQYTDRATVTLEQPQKSVSDLLGGQFEASDHLWSTTEAGAFTGNFPGLEALCGNHDPASLEGFLDSCVAT